MNFGVVEEQGKCPIYRWSSRPRGRLNWGTAGWGRPTWSRWLGWPGPPGMPLVLFLLLHATHRIPDDHGLSPLDFGRHAISFGQNHQSTMHVCLLGCSSMIPILWTFDYCLWIGLFAGGSWQGKDPMLINSIILIYFLNLVLPLIIFTNNIPYDAYMLNL